MTTYTFRGTKRVIPPMDNHCICGKEPYRRRRDREDPHDTATVLRDKPQYTDLDTTGVGIFHAFRENA